MRVRVFFIAFTICLILFGCKEKVSVWEPCRKSNRDISISMLPMEKVILDSVHTSFTGFSGVYCDSKVFFYDKYFGFLFLFNPDGSFSQKILGYGRGPSEVIISSAVGGAVDKSGNLCLIGSTMDFETFDSKNRRTTYVRFPYQPDEIADPSNFYNYSFSTSNLQIRFHQKELFVNLQSQRPDYNHFDNQSDYLNTSYRVGVVNPATKSARMIVKGFPPLYMDSASKYVSFDLVNIEIQGSNLLVNFEADSTIYRCTFDGVPQDSFGAAGRDMDLDYLETKGMNEQAFRNYSLNRNTKGGYGKIVAAGEYVFRSYTRGIYATMDGLQIYKNSILIGDVDVPRGFNVAGKLGSIFCSEIFTDVDAGEMFFYRFQM